MYQVEYDQANWLTSGSRPPFWETAFCGTYTCKVEATQHLLKLQKIFPTKTHLVRLVCGT